MKNQINGIAYLFATFVFAQEHTHAGAKPLQYPDIPGFVTLKTDLHQHSVFSDGNVWPTIRVMEALRENLDAISLTEHLEYQLHKEDIPHPDRNRAYHLAMDEAKNHNLIIISGSEITRSAPVGHSNAVFIKDANPLLAKDSLTPFVEAKKQGAFVFWNHPAWYAQSPKGNPILSNFQKERIKNKELHGIEVINTGDYSPEAFAIALEQNLTIMGTSDIHGLIEWDYTEKGNHRPITLVFAKERSVNGIRDALFSGRTVAVFNSLMVGKEEFLKPLLEQCLKIEKAAYINKTEILEVTLKNISSSDLILENVMPFTFYHHAPVFQLKANSSITLQIKTLERLTSFALKLKAISTYTAPKENPVLQWDLPIEN